jgi:hypothetical protein
LLLLAHFPNSLHRAMAAAARRNGPSGVQRAVTELSRSKLLTLFQMKHNKTRFKLCKVCNRKVFAE